MQFDCIVNYFKTGALDLDTAKVMLSAIKTQDNYEESLKSFLLKEMTGISEQAMNILIILNEFTVDCNAQELCELFEIPIKKDLTS